MRQMGLARVEEGPGLKPPGLGGGLPWANKSDGKINAGRGERPQRLKPRCYWASYGTDKSVPLTKRAFSAFSKARCCFGRRNDPRITRARAVVAAGLLVIGVLAVADRVVRAETCATQSGLSLAERSGIVDAARNLATMVQANDAAGLKTLAVAEVAKDFGSLQYLVGGTAPKLTGGAVTVEQVYLLDATGLKRNTDGSASDAQFFCSLNRSTMEAEFTIPALPPGKYAFAMVTVAPAPAAAKAAPWRLSFLLRQEQGKWLMAGFYPKALTAAGHDGLWYWTQARQMVKDKQQWNAWLYYQAAQKLLQPADFVMSTHLEKLQKEATDAAPPVLSEGVSVDAPLVVKGSDGTEYHFTGLGVDDTLAQPSLDIAAHLHVDATADPAAARKRNTDAASALLAAYPEMRKPFHGVWVYAEAAGQNPFATEQPMAEIK